MTIRTASSANPAVRTPKGQKPGPNGARLYNGVSLNWTSRRSALLGNGAELYCR